MTLDIAGEQNRFNALPQERASEILREAEGQFPHFRYCWYCNGAHEHLQSKDVILCLACGIYYLQGYPSGAVIRRSKNEMVTSEDMARFAKTLEDAD